MNEYDLADLITAPRPLRQLTIPPIEDEEGRENLLKHGCTIEERPRSRQCIIYFPEGTTKIEILLRLLHPRYRIILPDGYELHKIYDRFQKISFLSYPTEKSVQEWEME